MDSYLYAYVVNESNINVFFDDFTVQVLGSRAIRKTDYYPFGAVAKQWNNPDQTQQEKYRHGYQGQYAEMDTTTGWNAFQLRMYDPIIGRWLQVDPAGQYASSYVGMGNNPVYYVDPDGGCVNEDGFNVPCPDGISKEGNLNTIILNPLSFVDPKAQNNSQSSNSNHGNHFFDSYLNFLAETGKGVRDLDNETHFVEKMAYTTKVFTGASAVENGKILFTGYNDMGEYQEGLKDRVVMPAIDVAATVLPPLKGLSSSTKVVKAIDYVEKTDQVLDAYEIKEIWSNSVNKFHDINPNE